MKFHSVVEYKDKEMHSAAIRCFNSSYGRSWDLNYSHCHTRV